MRRFNFLKGLCLGILLLPFGSPTIKRRSLEGESSLDFLTDHLQPELEIWSWNQLRDSEETNPTVEELEEGEMEEREVRPVANLRWRPLREELVSVLEDLKTQGKPSAYVEMKVPTYLMNRLIELDKAMRRAEWGSAWETFRASARGSLPSYWERSIKAQVEQVKLIEGWQATKIRASDNLKRCMELLRAEEYWPVFSGIEYEAITETKELIEKMSHEHHGLDYKQLRKLMPPRTLEKRQASMEYMAHRPDIISYWYSDEELKEKEEKGYDTLLMMRIEELLYMATQLDVEPSKDKKAWNIFANLFRILHGGYVTDVNSMNPWRFKSDYWPVSVEFQLFTSGLTPHSDRFRNGFQMLLRHLDKIKKIDSKSMDHGATNLAGLLTMAGDWSLSDILLGLHNGVNLITFHACSHHARSSYIPNAAHLRRETGNVAQAYRVMGFLQARMKLRKGDTLESYRPLKSLEVR
ncbi:uncharacterized protein MELLADRAFT_61794 [Melampsora larici-populina 98AG31]|uniref:Secreted protein n=1 Tax=Melampsora larici-populina (strain 98AG31 / pathotype 3-4-7) TaxID=747676 RepID=F4RGI1_MELLP|nr:uncharacterized protein MELLADRAFT_61794 [Melampsora larici-populina 98AG31]EGG08644.1 hypothetical protein MELLADRAFT_61794 [Melampsora larici-populina 98AG31]